MRFFLGCFDAFVIRADFMQKTIKIILLILGASTSQLTYAADDESSTPSSLVSGVGAVLTLVAAADDPQAYSAHLKRNTELFESAGMQAAGTCIIHTGNDYAGKMVVWGVVDSVQRAMEASSRFDYLNTTRKLRSLRDPKYTTLFRSLKTFIWHPAWNA